MTSAADRAGPRPWLGGWHLLVPLFAFAVGRDLWAPDEPRYAEVAREAYESGGLLVMHLCGEVYPDKPPLVYWLAGMFGRLAAWNEFALRLPLLLATLGSALLAVRIARRHLGETAAAWTPVFFLGTAMVVWYSGRLQLDSLLAFFCLAAVDLVWNESGTAAQRARRLVLAGLCTGLAALCKGPVAWLHVGLALGALYALPRAPVRPARLPAAAWVGFVVLAVVPVVTWAAAAALREPALWGPLFVGQHLGRAMEGAAPHAGPPWKHVLQVAVLFLPWTPLLWLGFVATWRAGHSARNGGARSRSVVRMAGWFVAVLVVFSAMPPKREIYLLPVYPAAAWLAAAGFERALTGGGVVRFATAGVSGLFALLGVGALVGPRVVAELAPYAWPSTWTALPFLAGAAASLEFLRRENLGRWADSIALGFTGAGLAAALFVIPAIDAHKSARGLAEIVAERPEKPTRIPCVGVQPEGYRFYGRVPTVRGDPFALLSGLEHEGPAFLGLVSEKEWMKVSPAMRAQFDVLWRQSVGSRAILLLGRAAKSDT